MMVRPVMLYGMEAVALTKAQEKKMEVMEMRMLHFSVGKPRMDRVRNDVIRTPLEVDELSGTLGKTRLRWYGHVLWRDEGYVGQQTRRMMVGTRGRGRPKLYWMDCVREDLRVAGMMEKDALDRPNWRWRIHTGDPT